MNGLHLASAGDVVFDVALVIAALALARVVPMTWRLWRHGQRLSDRNPTFTAADRLDTERTLPAACVAGVLGVSAGGVHQIFGSVVWANVVLLVCGAGFVCGGLLMVTVHYAQRPQWAIPPVLRRGARDGDGDGRPGPPRTN